MTKPIELIHAEIIDASHEMAECIRDQANCMLRRADGVEQSTKYVDIPATNSEQAAEAENSLQIKEDMSTARLREEELQVRYTRLTHELQVQKRRSETKNVKFTGDKE